MDFLSFQATPLSVFSLGAEFYIFETKLFPNKLFMFLTDRAWNASLNADVLGSKSLGIRAALGNS